MAKASTAGKEKSRLGRVVGRRAGAENVCWNENLPLNLMILLG